MKIACSMRGAARPLAGLVLATALLAPPAEAGLSESLPTPTPPPLPGLSLTRSPVSGAFLFYEDFERGTKRWRVPNAAMGWHVLNAPTCGGMFTMQLGAKPPRPARLAASESYLELKAPLDLRRAKHPVLKYDVKGLASPYQAVSYQAELKVQGAWKPIGPVIDGRFELMRSIYLDMKGYAGQQVALRFRGRTRPTSVPTGGLYLDDIHVIDSLQP